MADQAELGAGFRLTPFAALRYVTEQAAVVGPLLFAAMAAAGVGLLRRGRRSDAAEALLFWLGAPVFGLLFLKSLQGEVEANWAAPAYVTLAILATHRFDRWLRRASGPEAEESVENAESPAAPRRPWRRRALLAGASAHLALCLLAACLVYEPSCFRGMASAVGSVTGRTVPAAADAGGYRTVIYPELAEVVEAMRGEDRFLLAGHYQDAAAMAFYVDGRPHTFVVPKPAGGRPTQYDGWSRGRYGREGLAERRGRNSLYVTASDGESVRPRARVLEAFARVGPPRILRVRRRGLVYRTYRIFPCEGFRGFDATAASAAAGSPAVVARPDPQTAAHPGADEASQPCINSGGSRTVAPRATATENGLRPYRQSLFSRIPDCAQR